MWAEPFSCVLYSNISQHGAYELRVCHKVKTQQIYGKVKKDPSHLKKIKGTPRCLGSFFRFAVCLLCFHLGTNLKFISICYPAPSKKKPVVFYKTADPCCAPVLFQFQFLKMDLVHFRRIRSCHLENNNLSGLAEYTGLQHPASQS